MKDSLSIGVTGQVAAQVGPGQTISLGGGVVTVFSTPAMINLMEHAARQAMQPHLQASEESVGVDVQITHSSATPPRVEVIAEAVVTKIDKNVISFDVVARDPWGEIGRGSHRRAVIKTAAFAERLAQQKTLPDNATEPSTLPSMATMRFARAGALLRINLNRPDKKNAINAEMTGELEQLVDWLSIPSNDIRVVTVSGIEGNFSTVNALAVQAAALPAAAVAASKRLLSPGSEWNDDTASVAFTQCLQTETARRSIARFRPAR